MAPMLSLEDVDQATITDVAAQCGIPQERVEDVFSCTPLQVATITEATIHTGASVFQFVLTLAPSVEHDRFCFALRKVVSLNSILRTQFVDTQDHGLLQVVVDRDHDTRRVADGTLDLDRYLQCDKETILGLATPLLRTAIICNKLVLTIHHAIMDHASLTPLFRDILSVYHGVEPQTRPQFKDFVTYSLGIDDETAASFWKSRFKGSPSIFPSVADGYLPMGISALHRRFISEHIASGDISLAHVPSYIEAAWALAAAFYATSDSVAFGLVLSGRNSACKAAEGTLGPTIAIVPVQVIIRRDSSVGNMMKELATFRRQLQAAPALQYGLSKIRGVSEAARSASRFQTLLNIRPRWYDSNEEYEVSFDSMQEPAAAFALSLNCDLEQDGVSIDAIVDPSVVSNLQLGRILDQFEHFLKSLLEARLEMRINDLSSLSPNHFSQIVVWNRVGLAEPMQMECIHELFRHQVRQHSSAMALDAWDGTATYRELDYMTGSLACELLRQASVSVGSHVGVVFEKSIWAVVAALAILKAGGAVVCISAEDPASRKSALVSRAGIQTILTSVSCYESCRNIGATHVMSIDATVIANLVEGDPECAKIDPHDLAYITFTSGSTGEPKGAMLEHRNITSAITQLRQKIGWRPETRMLQFGSYTWDIHLGETYGALLTGGCLCIPSEDDRRSRLVQYINTSRIECMWQTPTVLRTIATDDVPGLRTLISAGEAVMPDAAKTWGAKLRLFNGWGPCETSIISALGELTPDSTCPQSIGCPLNSALWLVNPKNVNELVPIGAAGEIIVAGPGVSRGYVKDETKTKASFVSPPRWARLSTENARNDTTRMYRTGDLARYNDDGSIHFVGRQDTQVKIRGQRLEIGEVESAIASCEEILDSFTATRIIAGRTHLVAVVSFADDNLSTLCGQALYHSPVEYTPLTPLTNKVLGKVRDKVRSRLPAFMVPTVWLCVQDMPRTASAKLDRLAVSKWLKDQSSKTLAASLAASTGSFDKPVTPPKTWQEKILQSTWASALGVSETTVGLESCFVTLGGDSIMVMRVSSQCLKQGLAVSASLILKNEPLATVACQANQAELHSANATTDTLLDTQEIDDVLISFQDLQNFPFPLVKAGDIEAIVPVTDGQATMIATGELGGRGYYMDFDLQCHPGLDLTQLRSACQATIQHHAELRTVFVCRGENLYQAVLKDAPPGAVETDTQTEISCQDGTTSARFQLFSDNRGKCSRVCLKIHHAVYDAVSLSLVFRDLQAAYTNTNLSNSTQFYAWVSHVLSLDLSDSLAFWEATLRGSSMTHLLPAAEGGLRDGKLLSVKTELSVPLQNVASTASATASSVLKAAWAILLWQATGCSDVVFGEVSANRNLNIPGIDSVRGPCVNQIPVRAQLQAKSSNGMTLQGLVSQIHELHTTGMPHSHIGTRRIVRECTDWPRWTRMSTSIVYQNHRALENSVTIGAAECPLTVRGEIGDSTDLHVVATPNVEESTLDVVLCYSPLAFSARQISWISDTFAEILRLLPDAMGQGLHEMEVKLRATLNLPPYTSLQAQRSSSGEQPSPVVVSPAAMELVTSAWQAIGLDTAGEREVPLWAAGADVVDAFLLSGQYRHFKKNLTLNDIVEYPTRIAQAILIADRQEGEGKQNGRIQ